MKMRICQQFFVLIEIFDKKPQIKREGFPSPKEQIKLFALEAFGEVVFDIGTDVIFGFFKSHLMRTRMILD